MGVAMTKGDPPGRGESGPMVPEVQPAVSTDPPV